MFGAACLRRWLGQLVGSGLRHVLHSRFRVRVQRLNGKLMAPEAVGHYTAQAVAEFELGASPSQRHNNYASFMKKLRKEKRNALED